MAGFPASAGLSTFGSFRLPRSAMGRLPKKEAPITADKTEAKEPFHDRSYPLWCRPFSDPIVLDTHHGPLPKAAFHVKAKPIAAASHGVFLQVEIKRHSLE